MAGCSFYALFFGISFQEIEKKRSRDHDAIRENITVLHFISLTLLNSSSPV